MPQLCLCKLQCVSQCYTDVRNCPPVVAELCRMDSIAQGLVCGTNSSHLSCDLQHRPLPACDRSDHAALPPGHTSCCSRWALQGFVDGASNLAHTKDEDLLVNTVAGSSAAARLLCGCSGPSISSGKALDHIFCPDVWACLLDHRAQTTGCLWAWTLASIAEQQLSLQSAEYVKELNDFTEHSEKKGNSAIRLNPVHKIVPSREQSSRGKKCYFSCYFCHSSEEGCASNPSQCDRSDWN